MGNGNLALIVFHRMDQWPETVGDLRLVIQDRGDVTKANYNHCLGTILHELCHTFDLFHEPVGIMSRDFSFILDVFSYRLNSNILEKDEIPQKIYGNTIFSTAALSILSHHAWLNDYCQEEKPDPRVNGYRIHLSCRDSEAAIKLVQIYLKDKVVKHFEVEPARTTFSLCRKDLESVDLRGQNVLNLLIMDNFGDVSRKIMNVYDVYLNLGE